MTATRPPDRKEQIGSTASDLFLQHGYHNVSVADVADALGITPAALYYHYLNKQDLLLHAVLEGFDAVDGVITQAADLTDALRSLTALVVSPRPDLAIWVREARYLDGPHRETIRSRRAELAAHLVPLLLAERPGLSKTDAELVAWALLGALSSRTRHRLSMPRRKYEQLMYRLGWLTAHCEVREHEPLSSPVEFDTAFMANAVAGLRRPRRDQLLTEAIRLFDERGYQSVTMADIGEAAGIVASGVYRHFPGKTDLLVAATNRAGERVRAGADQALTQARDPSEALDLLLRAHVRIAIEDRHLVGILANERDQLPEKQRLALRRFQADYLAIWVEVLGALLPEREPSELKLVIHAVHSMIYLVVQSGRTEIWPDLHEQLTDLGMALLLKGLADN